jgi:hypothetical protein
MMARSQPRGIINGAVILLVFMTLVLLLSWGSIKNTSWGQSVLPPPTSHGDGAAVTAVSECRLDGSKMYDL